MRGSSHLIIGSSLSLATVSLAPQATHPGHLFAAWLLGSLAATLPDIDADNSLLQVFLIQSGRSRLADKLIGYRTSRSIFGGLLHAALGAIEITIRLTFEALFNTLKLFATHRGITHSLITVTLITVITSTLLWVAAAPQIYAATLFIGYLSHLLADACTISGVRFLNPISRKTYHILPKPLRFATGTFPEVIALAVIVIPTIIVIFARFAGP